MVDTELVIPYAKPALVGQVSENARVVSESFDEAGRTRVPRALPAAAAKLRRLLTDA
jgi:GTP-binding protein HflX